MRIGLAGWLRDSAGGDHQVFLRLFERADELGFDSTWFNEFHFNRTDLPYPDTLLLAAAVFARTERLRVGTSVVVLPVHHPLLLAEQVAQLDYQSGGRLDLGVGRGSTSPEQFGALGIDLDSTRSRFEEAYDVLVAALSRPSTSHAGEYWRFQDVAVGPAPVQQPHPPIYMAAYSRDSIAFAAERRVPLLLSLEPPEEKQLTDYREIAAECGYSQDTSRFSYMRYVCLGRTSAEAEALVDDLLPRLHRRRLALAARRGQGASGVELRSRESFVATQAIVGDPQQCITRLRALSQSRVTHLRLVFNGNGEYPLPAALKSMEFFAREVMPECRRMATTA